MDSEELKKILEEHSIWLSSHGEKGKQANFEDADLRQANLRDADLRQTNLSGANLRGANLIGANLHLANLMGANLTDANLTRAYLNNVYLNNAYLKDAYLNGADLSEANLYGADLSGADLVGTNFIGACLNYVNLEGATLSEKELVVGNRYELTYRYSPYYFNKAIVCLLSINKDNTLDLIESVSGTVHRSVEIWLKYSMKEINPEEYAKAVEYLESKLS